MNCNGPDLEHAAKLRKEAEMYYLLADYYELSSDNQKIFMAAFKQTCRNKTDRKIEDDG